MGFTLKEHSTCEENGPGRTLAFEEELPVPKSEAAMTPRAFSKSLVRIENGTDFYGRVIKREKRENKHSMKASCSKVLAEAIFLKCPSSLLDCPKV